MLYMRMFFLMTISLYTSRAILEALGIENYGIYNVVGSVLILFSFLTSALSSSTRRYLNYWLGRNNEEALKKVFSICFSIHTIIAIIIVLLGETIGLWLVNNVLNLPTDRMYAANWVYQITILSAVVGILSVPFESAIVAKEKLSVYAYISIFEAILKLVMVFLLFHSPFDVLIYYAILIFVVTNIVTVFKFFYCLKKFDFCQPRIIFSKAESREVGSFTGWSLFGQLSYVGSTTGVNMIINVFLGVSINAAVGIANQVNNIVYNFVSNFQTSFNPQLIQTYSSNNMSEHRLLISRASRISLYLLILISVPVILNVDFLLNLWLTEVPEYSPQFLTAILWASVIEAYGAPLWMSMQAIGKIRNYQITVSIINALIIPYSFFALFLGYSPVWIFKFKIIINIILLIYRIVYILPKIQQSRQRFLVDNVLRSAIIMISAFLITRLFACWIINPWPKLIITTMVSIGLIFGLVYCFGLTREEKVYVKRKIIDFRLKILT